MNPYRDILVTLLKRLIFAIPFLGFGLFALFHAEGGMLTGVVLGLVGCAGLLLGAIILAFPVARLIAEPVGNLYFSNKHFDGPRPMYGVPESRRKFDEWGWLGGCAGERLQLTERSILLCSRTGAF